MDHKMNDKKRADYRIERDSIGAKDVPKDVYYGVQSLRAAENFHITGLNIAGCFLCFSCEQEGGSGYKL